MQSEHHNRLINETSPYLQQHALNPVNWYPWGPDALKAAQALNKPILLSIGYSACHWCHVMAHESFEDEATAALMNALYINVKVDREERPDLDRIYQRAHQLLSQRSGGWPLTMFLMPDDQTPFFGGTYFPPEARHGLPAFRNLLQQIAEFYREHPDDLREQNQALRQALSSLEPQKQAGAIRLEATLLDRARHELEQSTDTQWGGLGRAPKFPHPYALERLLRHWAHTKQQDTQALHLVNLSLKAMALGGVNDQLSGGFCRYSTDDYWMIPHFEKMLYDNAPLIDVYTQAYAATGNPLYRKTVYDTVEWVLHTLQSPEGGFYSSLDADSEGEEGKYYAWTPDEVRGHLEDLDYRIFARRFGLDRDPNFEAHWHLHVFQSLEALAEEFTLSIDEIEQRINRARKLMGAVRAQRVAPGCDDKILVSWNALMIKALALASRVFDEPRWYQAALKALDFIRRKMLNGSRLLASYKDGKAHLNAYLDDYAFLLHALLELLQTHWRSEDLDFSLLLAEILLEQFQDTDAGGFYFTSHDHETLIQRQKPLSDESLPSGNAIAAYALNRLGHLLGESRYLTATERCLLLAFPAMDTYPSAYNTMLLALEEYLYPVECVILRGSVETLTPWIKETRSTWHPRRMVFAIPNDATIQSSALLARQALGTQAIAYWCTGSQCEAPITEFELFKQRCNLSERA